MMLHMPAKHSGLLALLSLLLPGATAMAAPLTVSAAPEPSPPRWVALLIAVLFVGGTVFVSLMSSRREHRD